MSLLDYENRFSNLKMNKYGVLTTLSEFIKNRISLEELNYVDRKI